MTAFELEEPSRVGAVEKDGEYRELAVFRRPSGAEETRVVEQVDQMLATPRPTNNRKVPTEVELRTDEEGVLRC